MPIKVEESTANVSQQQSPSFRTFDDLAWATFSWKVWSIQMQPRLNQTDKGWTGREANTIITGLTAGVSSCTGAITCIKRNHNRPYCLAVTASYPCWVLCMCHNAMICSFYYANHILLRDIITIQKKCCLSLHNNMNKLTPAPFNFCPSCSRKPLILFSSSCRRSVTTLTSVMTMAANKSNNAARYGTS